ncbi:hypothetical protein ACTVOO_02640 [Serratia bockelmannii]|uniref:hypothetical protein n=1 Tax=Serratia bockelmannii TaxID=2703793 RepID=UPI003FA78BEF
MNEVLTYEALKAERDALERQLSMLEAKCKGYFSDAAAALVKCDALAVENQALKDACGGDGSYRDCPACAHSQYIESPETPATDAALSAIQAQAIEDAVTQVLSVDTIASTAVISHLLRTYATELREAK